jgi:hypothetical protein
VSPATSPWPSTSTEARRDATYYYAEAEDASGELLFSIQDDIHKDDPSKPLVETLTIDSQWMADGTGRADVRLEGGEIPGDLAAHNLGTDHVSMVECWDASFGLTYADTTPEELRKLGNADCDDAGNCQAVGSADACSIVDGETPASI